MPTDSLFTAVSGLSAYQNAIDVISNNIANVGTTGFKGQEITFQDLLYQSQAFATAPTQTKGGTDPQDEGLGVKTSSISTDFSQGGLQTTGINTDLAINGEGFFILKNVDGSGVPAYTRDGHFSLNVNGVLYDPASGLAVSGYQANANGVVTVNGNPGAIQVPIGLKSQAVGTGFGTKTGPLATDQNFDAVFGGNLDQTLYLQANSGAATPVTISTTIYDSLGNSHLVNITFTPLTSSAGGGAGVNPITTQVLNTQGVATSVGTEWGYTITGGDPTDPLTAQLAAEPAADTSGNIFFDQNGQFINTSSLANGGPGAYTAANTHQIGAHGASADGNLLVVTGWGAPGNNASPTTAANPAAIALDFADMSSLAGSSTATTVSQNGYGQGTLANITIGGDGKVTGAFTNGQQVTLAQIALATFQNDNGLQRVGSSEFVSTANSGLPQVNVPQTGQLGSIVSGSLEESNVALSAEFVKMIEAQNAFNANSKSVTVANQELQTVIGLIPGG
jgi:flagellar hook protein FlgE